MHTSIAVAAVLLFSSTSHAQPAEPPKPSQPAAPVRAKLEKRPVAIVISGGASLGTHEAGYVYVISEALKRQKIPLRVTTGASAGSGNAFLTALSSCLPSNPKPETTMGWKVWVDTGFDDLFHKDEVTAISAFSTRNAIATLGVMKSVWRSGLPTSCDVVVAVTVTKLDPLSVTLVDELTVPRQLLRVAVRIRGRGPNRAPSVENVVDPKYGAPQMLLPLSGSAELGAALEDFDRLVQLITASGAFPVAFKPVELDFCLRSRSVKPCTKAEQKALFIDGGVFDNIPLGLASGLGRVIGLDRPRFLYLDPGLRAYPETVASVDQQQPTSAASLMARIGKGFFDHAINAELYALLEDDPGALKDVFVGLSRYPQASGFVSNFFGVFEQDFRRFDFYLGMYDALRDLEGWPELGGRALADLKRAFSTIEPLACLTSWYDGDADHKACDDPALRNLRVLTQISLDRVYSTCRDSKQAAPKHPHCELARGGKYPPAVVEMAHRSPGYGLQRASETAFDHNLRLLAAYGFHFRDLGLDPSQSKLGRKRIANRLNQVLHRFGSHQPDLLSRNLIGMAALEMVGPIYYEPPRHYRYLMLGTAAELGASWALPKLPSWFRINTASVFDGLVSMLTQDSTDLDITVAAGPDIELRAFTTRRFAATVGARVGYQFGWGDRFTTEACTQDRAKGDARDCSQIVVQGLASLVVVERVRLQALFVYYPELPDFDDRFYNVHFGFGLQF